MGVCDHLKRIRIFSFNLLLLLHLNSNCEIRNDNLHDLQLLTTWDISKIVRWNGRAHNMDSQSNNNIAQTKNTL